MASASSVNSVLVTEDEARYRQNFERSLAREGVISRRLNCTICNINIQHRLVTRRNVHTSLGVIVCNSCSHRIRFTNPETKNKTCQWCVQDDKFPNNLISCKRCPRKFCRKCIRAHARTTKLNDWICFVCQLDRLWPLRALCNASVTYSERLKTEIEERRASLQQRNSSSRTAASRTTLHISPRVTAIFSPSRLGPDRRRTEIYSPAGNLSISVTGTHNVSVTLTSTTTTNSNSTVAAGLNRTSILREKSCALNKNEDEASFRQGQEQLNCVICLDEEPRIACVPCGHLCLCESCSSKFRQNFHRCPICNNVFRDTLKIYL